MGHYEDRFHEIYEQVENKGILKEFMNTVSNISSDSKYKFKSTKEIWEIAYLQLINNN